LIIGGGGHVLVSSFDSAYSGTPPWDIGRPQSEIVRLAAAGEIRGDVLDVGCGTGENLLYLAALGHNAVGIDLSPTAIHKARKKAESRGQKARFVVGDALSLEELRANFDSVIDCGLFHTFSDEMRLAFARSLHSVLNAQGRYFMLCFSELEPDDWGGPRRVSQKEIRDTFHKGWRINYIREARFETNWPQIEGRAWLSSIILA
jgi:cyclopropane fatty-acyl-phospholipid synthase-like methyltransferase